MVDLVVASSLAPLVASIPDPKVALTADPMVASRGGSEVAWPVGPKVALLLGPKVALLVGPKVALLVGPKMASLVGFAAKWTYYPWPLSCGMGPIDFVDHPAPGCLLAMELGSVLVKFRLILSLFLSG